MEPDIKHLRIAGILHYVFAGFSGFLLLIPLGYIAVTNGLFAMTGILIVVGFTLEGTHGAVSVLTNDAVLSLIYYFLAVCFGGIFGIFLLSGVVTNFYCGKFLREQRNYLFCLIITALTITSIPIGTIVGVYTLVMLLKDPVKELFEKNAEIAMTEKPARIGLFSNSFVGYGVLSLLGTSFALVHLIAAIVYQTGTTVRGGNYDLTANGFVIAGSALIFVTGLALSIMTIVAGLFFKKRKNYIFCFVTAVINSIFAPFGTILGLYAIHTLLKDSVRAEFRTKRPGDLR